MSVWTTKASGRDRHFIVLQHKIKGVNYVVNGVKFRDSYAVLEKDSKIYRNLMQVPVLKGSREFPLIFLRQLPFITRSLDVKNVFGQEVYTQYLKELDVFIKEQEIQKQEEGKVVQQEQEEKHVEHLCSHRLDNGKLCGLKSLEHSPSGYCGLHFFEDLKFASMGIQIPRFMTKKEKQKLKEKLLKQFADNKKE